MFASDRDLLAMEPNLFRDQGWVGQRLVSGIGGVAGTTLTLTAQDVNFADGGVEAGCVVLVDGAAYEVVERLTATTATISRLRDDPEGAVLVPSPATAKPVVVQSFRPQIAMVHAQVLRMLGIEPGAEPAEGQPGEGDITNPGAMRPLEVLGTLHLIFTGAAAPGAGFRDSHEFDRGAIYRERYAAERQRVVAQVDLDGDGLPDATRRLNAVQFVRA